MTTIPIPATNPETLALRPREAARALGVSQRTLWQWTHHGDLPHIRIGRAILYPVADLRAWLARQTVASVPAPADAPETATEGGAK